MFLLILEGGLSANLTGQFTIVLAKGTWKPVNELARWHRSHSASSRIRSRAPLPYPWFYPPGTPDRGLGDLAIVIDIANRCKAEGAEKAPALTG